MSENTFTKEDKTFTVEAIFNKLTRLKEELEELKKAKDILYEEQEGSVAHTLVKNAYDEKYKEVNRFRNTRFTEYTTEPRGEFFEA